MDFIEIAVVDIDGEAAETVSDLFNRYGYGGAVIETLAPNFDKAPCNGIIQAIKLDVHFAFFPELFGYDAETFSNPGIRCAATSFDILQPAKDAKIVSSKPDVDYADFLFRQFTVGDLSVFVHDQV